jgi:integrase
VEGFYSEVLEDWLTPGQWRECGGDAKLRGMPRRSKGEGTLEWMPKTKRWRVRVTVTTPEGTKKRKAFTAPTKKAVIAKRDAFLATPYDSEMTVGAYLDRWMRDSVEQTRRPATIAEYESVCRVHLKPHLGRIKLRDLKAAHVQAMLTRMREEGCAGSTLRRLLAILGAALNQAVRWQLLTASPMTGVEKPKNTKKKERQSLTAEQTRRLFDAAKAWRGGRLHPVMVLAVATGMRQGEILGLMWEDFDTDRGTLTVQRTLHRERGGYSHGPTKSGKPRVLELDSRLVALLQAHRRRQLEERMAASEWTDTGHIFTTPEGRPIHRAVLYQSFKRLCRREGLPDVTFHELRHTAATILAQRGAHPNTVQDILGHSDVTTTLRTYTHAWPHRHRDAATKLADVLF